MGQCWGERKCEANDESQLLIIGPLYVVTNELSIVFVDRRGVPAKRGEGIFGILWYIEHSLSIFPFPQTLLCVISFHLLIIFQCPVPKWKLAVGTKSISCS